MKIPLLPLHIITSKAKEIKSKQLCHVLLQQNLMIKWIDKLPPKYKPVNWKR